MSMVIWKEYITVAYVVQRSAQSSVFGNLTVACQFCFVTNKYMYLFFLFQAFYLLPTDDFIGFHGFEYIGKI